MKKKKQEQEEKEWSYILQAEDIGKRPVALCIKANEKECAGLSSRFDVSSIHSLRADFSIVRESGGFLIHVKGLLRAEIIQACAVSGDPVTSYIKEDFEAFFSDPSQAVSFEKAKSELYISHGFIETPVLSEREDPDPVLDGKIDLADLALQYFSLYIDSYPHAEGVLYEHDDSLQKSCPSEIRKNPFQALKDWREQKDTNSK